MARSDEPLADIVRAQILLQLRLTRRAITRLEEEVSERVEVARQAGITWQQIADALGVTNQAAQQRFGRSKRR